VREKVYGPEAAGTAVALQSLGNVYVKMGQPDAAEPLLRRALKIRRELIGGDHAFAASGYSDLASVSLARGDWSAALASYRQAVRLITSQDTSQIIVKSLVEEEIRRFSETFVGLSRAAWQLSATSGSDRAALLKETYAAGQLAWTTSAASALAKMSARLGAGETDLGRRIRRVQDLSERVLRLHADDQRLLTEWSAVERADPVYSQLLAQFRADSIARSRDQAPAIKRQRELIEQRTGLLKRCPQDQGAGCEAAKRERAAITQELSELSQAISAGAGAITALKTRMEAAEKALPGFQQFTATRSQ